MVEITDYAEAICFSNKLDGQLMVFEEHLQRQPYELFIEYSELMGISQPLDMSNHILAQHGFIKPSQKPAPQIETLIAMSNTASVNGIFVKTEEGVRYEPKVLPKFGASFMKSEGTKEQRATKVHSGFKYKETEWSSLSKLLAADTAYSPFQFRDGKRSNDNITSGTSWIVLDVDDSGITIDEAGNYLQDYDTILSTTSNKDNPYKFRVLLKLNQYVQVDSHEWKVFVGHIAQELGIESPDLLAKSQIFYGYKGSKVIVNEGDEFDCTEALIAARKKELVVVEEMSVKERKELIDDSFNKLAWLYDAEENRSVKMFSASAHMFESGFKLEEIMAVLHQVLDFWDSDAVEFNKRTGLFTQLERKFKKKKEENGDVF